MKSKTLANIESDWATFFDYSYDGIIIADGEGKIVYMNKASEELEETPTSHIIGRNARELEEEGTYEKSVTLMVLQSKKTESISQFKLGKQLVITGTPIFEDGRIKWIYINERDVTELAEIKKDVERYKKKLDDLRKEKIGACDDFVVSSIEMKKIVSQLKRVATTEATVLMEGESGVGKDVLARWTHKNSNRKSKPFVKIDCSALPESLFESEFFGYEKGAFTDAKGEGKIGLIETANGGTLFLDEIGEMPINMQVKLLRVLQDKTYIPVGAVKEKRADIRVIAATNRNLEEMIENKSFRKDLFYRLNVIPIKVPSLRERREDIISLIGHFADEYNKKYGLRKKISPAALNLLYNYSWPGNVREVGNVIERLFVMVSENTIHVEDVLLINPSISKKPLIVETKSGISYQTAIDAFEQDYFYQVLQQGMRLSEIAMSIGMSESTLKRKLRKYNLSPKVKME